MQAASASRSRLVWGANARKVVPRGVEHCPRADGEVSALLIEPQGTVNTGDTPSERTAPLRELD